MEPIINISRSELLALKKNIKIEQSAILEFVLTYSNRINEIVEKIKIEGMWGYILRKDDISMNFTIESNLIRVSIKNKLLDFNAIFDKSEDSIYESYIKQIEMFAKQKLVRINNKYFLN